MKVAEDYEVLESVVVEMDPALDGFAGVLVELVLDGERYVLSETASGTGHPLLRVASDDRRYIYALFEAEIAADGNADRAWQDGERSRV